MPEEVPLEIEYEGRKYILKDEAMKQIQKLLKELVWYEENDWYRVARKLEGRLKEERRKWRTWEHCFISDIHAGSLWFDAPAFNRIIKKLEEEGIRCRNLHVLGDVVEGKFNHSGQWYESFPFPAQKTIAVTTIKKLVNVLRPQKLYIIPGNHDRKYGFNLLDVVIEELRDELDKVEIHYYQDDDYYVVDNILALHGITRSGGSDYTGLTPLIQNNIVPLSIETGTDIVVLGHYHRSVIIQYMGRLIIALQSFQYSQKPLRNERGLVLLRNSEEIRIVRTAPSKRSELVEYWGRKVRV